MSRVEFIDALQRALAESLGSSSVNENIRYYQEYIDTQVRSGQGEQEVIERLGDPRLLAKSIIEASRNEGRSYGREPSVCEEVYEDGTQSAERGNTGSRILRIPGWVVLVLVILSVIVTVSIVGTLVSALLPVLIPILCIVLMLRMIQRRR